MRERCLRPHDAPNAPLVVCLHGLNGSVSSFSRFSRLGAISRKTSLFLKTFSTVYLVHGLQNSLLTTCVCFVCFRSLFTLFMSKRSNVYLPIQANKLNQKKILRLSLKANVGASWLPGPCVWFARASKRNIFFATETEDPLERQVWVWTQRFTWTVGYRSLCPTGWRTKC